MALRNFELDPVAAKLVADGVITVTVVHTQDGVDAWARACRPHPGLNISPSVSMSLIELTQIFEKHSSLRDDTATNAELDEGLPSPSTRRHKEAVTSHRFVYPSAESPTRLKAMEKDISHIIRHWPNSRIGLEGLSDVLKAQSLDSCSRIVQMDKLEEREINGVKNLLPKDSLTKIDLERAPLHVFARMVTVSANLGNARLVSRIRSSQKFNFDAVPNLECWWIAASLEDKLSLLSSNKKLSVTKALASLTDQVKTGLAAVPCPFRNSPKTIPLSPNPQEYNSSGDEDEESN